MIIQKCDLRRQTQVRAGEKPARVVMVKGKAGKQRGAAAATTATASASQQRQQQQQDEEEAASVASGSTKEGGGGGEQRSVELFGFWQVGGACAHKTGDWCCSCRSKPTHPPNNQHFPPIVCLLLHTHQHENP